MNSTKNRTSQSRSGQRRKQTLSITFGTEPTVTDAPNHQTAEAR